MRNTIAAIGAATIVGATSLAAPAQAYTVNSNCGAWHDGSRACVTVRSTNIPGPSLRIENVRLCIEGAGYAQPGDARVYSKNVSVAGYPQQTGDCINWGADKYVDDDDVKVQSWGWAGPAGGPVWPFSVYVSVF